MTDTFSKNERSIIMRAVKSAGNKSTELKLITLFKEYKIRGWRRNYPIVGKPDFVFLKKRIAVFVDGCFWHGHPCRNIKPSDNSEYWKSKIEKNKKRDNEVSEVLGKKNWKVLRIWECELKKSEIIEKLKVLI